MKENKGKPVYEPTAEAVANTQSCKHNQGEATPVESAKRCSADPTAVSDRGAKVKVLSKETRGYHNDVPTKVMEEGQRKTWGHLEPKPCFGWHPIYEMENNPFMFETTNQYIMYIYIYINAYVLLIYTG